jgi:hypothetical protein
MLGSAAARAHMHAGATFLAMFKLIRMTADGRAPPAFAPPGRRGTGVET